MCNRFKTLTFASYFLTSGRHFYSSYCRFYKKYVFTILIIRGQIWTELSLSTYSTGNYHQVLSVTETVRRVHISGLKGFWLLPSFLYQCWCSEVHHFKQVNRPTDFNRLMCLMLCLCNFLNQGDRWYLFGWTAPLELIAPFSLSKILATDTSCPREKPPT